MMLHKKKSGSYRLLGDFRHINKLVQRTNYPFPLFSDFVTAIGHSNCTVISCIDIKEAYHCIPIHKDSTQYCGVTAYMGQPYGTLTYQRLVQGLHASPTVWMTLVNRILENIPHRNSYFLYMDDIVAFSDEKTHWELLENLFKRLEDNGLKISPSKAQLFQIEATYMGTYLKIRDGRPCFQPLRSRVEAIEHMQSPKSVKDVKRWLGMVNFLGRFIPQLQVRVADITNLTRKSVIFKWLPSHEKTYREINKYLTTQPILYAPSKTGERKLYSDGSFLGAGGSLWEC